MPDCKLRAGCGLDQAVAGLRPTLSEPLAEHVSRSCTRTCVRARTHTHTLTGDQLSNIHALTRQANSGSFGNSSGED